MKINVLRTILEWVLITSLAFSGYFLVRYYFRSHELRALNDDMRNEEAKLAQLQPIMSSLLVDVQEYAKTHPTILPVLQSLGLQAGGTNSIPTQPKPPGK